MEAAHVQKVKRGVTQVSLFGCKDNNKIGLFVLNICSQTQQTTYFVGVPRNVVTAKQKNSVLNMMTDTQNHTQTPTNIARQ